MHIEDLRFYLALLRGWLPLVVAMVLVFAMAGYGISTILPSSYQSQAIVLVETPQIPAQMAPTTVPESVTARLQLIEHQLLRPDALAGLAGTLGISLQGVPVEEAAEEMRNRIQLEQIPIGTPDQPMTMLSVAFKADTAPLAALGANTLANLILDGDAGRRRQRAAETLNFFRQEVWQLSSQLQQEESRLLEFKRDNVDALPESLLFRRSQQARQQEQLVDLQQEETTLRNRRSNLIVLFETTGRTIDSDVQTPESKLLSDMRLALASQLAMFSEDSQVITDLRQRIADLEQGTKAPTAAADIPAQLPSELALQVAEIDDRLQAIGREREAIGSAANALNASIRATPEHETALGAMERERDNLQLQYNTAVARLAEASTGEQIELRLKGDRLTLFQAATEPRFQLGPRRAVVIAGGALLGAMIGIGWAVVSEVLNWRVRRTVELRRGLGIEVLATIPYVSPRASAAPKGGASRMAGNALAIAATGCTSSYIMQVLPWIA